MPTPSIEQKKTSPRFKIKKPLDKKYGSSSFTGKAVPNDSHDAMAHAAKTLHARDFTATLRHRARQRVDGKPGPTKGDRAGALWAARKQRRIHRTEQNPKLLED